MPRRHHVPGTLDLVLSTLFVTLACAIVVAFVGIVAGFCFAVGKGLLNR